MYPEDRVLVGVINRKADLDHVRHDHWYRIPVEQTARGIHVEYLAFYLSRAFGAENGGVRYYARRTGHELVRRRDLLPEEADHPRAEALYYKIQLGELRPKAPPILNPTRRPVVFVYTTWDRFVAARQIGDLYSTADYFVDRVYFALQQGGIPSDRTWEAERVTDDGGAQIRIQCQRGDVIATTGPATEGRLRLPVEQGMGTLEQALQALRSRVTALGGPLPASIPLEN